MQTHVHIIVSLFITTTVQSAPMTASILFPYGSSIWNTLLTSPGIFLGYNIWKNLELYSYYERHIFEIKQLSSGEKQYIPSNDFGIGISYQFFIGRYIYIQPGIHSYFRAEKTINFSSNQSYSIPTFELSPIVRLGIRLWRKY